MGTGIRGRATWSWHRLVVWIALVSTVIAAPSPGLSLDPRKFPSTEAELDEWFSPKESDADPMSAPDAPPDLDVPGSPRTMGDKAKDARRPPPGREPRSIEERLKDTRTRYAAVLREVEAALKKPVEPASTPPDYELECNDATIVRLTTEQLVQAYAKVAGEPEIGLLTRLLDVRRELQLLGVTTLETHQAELAARLLAKTKGLIATWGRDRNKVLAVLGFAHRAQQVASLVGAEVGQSFFAEIAGWLKGLMPELLKDLRAKHDYRAVGAVLALAQAVVLAGEGTGISSEEMIAEIERAMAFDLSLKLYVRTTGANGNVEEWWLSSAMPLKARLTRGKDDPIPKLRLEGEGKGRYDRYREQDGDLRMTAPGFETVARVVEFDACAGSAVLAFDRFFADTETYHFKSGPPADLPMIQSAFVIFYGDKRSMDGYEFKVPLVNSNPEAVDTVVEETMGVFLLRLTVELTHTPK